MSKSRKSTRHVGFLSFFKLSLLYGLGVGQLGGLACLVCPFFGFPVDLNLGSWKLQGFPAALGLLVLVPLLMGVLSLLLAPVLYLPFTLASRLLGGFSPGEN